MDISVCVVGRRGVVIQSTKITVYHVTWRKVKLCTCQLINHVMVLNRFMFLEKNGVQKSRVMQK